MLKKVIINSKIILFMIILKKYLLLVILLIVYKSMMTLMNVLNVKKDTIRLIIKYVGIKWLLFLIMDLILSLSMNGILINYIL